LFMSARSQKNNGRKKNKRSAISELLFHADSKENFR
jgi:hypothetical protein